MGKRVFGGHALAHLSDLRRNPADGGAYYLALQKAAPDLFALADEHEKLALCVQKLVTAVEAVIEGNKVAAMPPDQKPTLNELSGILRLAPLKKFTAP